MMRDQCGRVERSWSDCWSEMSRDCKQTERSYGAISVMFQEKSASGKILFQIEPCLFSSLQNRSVQFILQLAVIFVETIFEIFQNDIPGKTNADSLVSETYSTFTIHLLFSEVFSSLFSVSGTSSLLYAFRLLLPSPQQVLMYPKQSLPVGQYMSTLQLL